MDNFEAPDLTHMSQLDLLLLMRQCGLSDDPSDKSFAKACRDELSRRKPSPTGAMEE